MNFKTKLSIVLIFITIIIFSIYFLYLNAIKPELVLNISEDQMLEKKYNLTYSYLLKSVKTNFNDTFKNYTKKPYKIDDSNSSITESYKLLKIEISKIKISNFPFRADITYDYEKNILYKNNPQQQINTNSKIFFLFDIKNKKWVNATLSKWLLPFVYLIFLILIAIIYNFFIKPKILKYKKMSNVTEVNLSTE